MIAHNLSRVKEQIALACLKAGRSPDEIRLVAVAKGRTCAQVEEASAAGITDIGENRVQEAVLKYSAEALACGLRRVKWHMVGRLQTNKAKVAVKIFDLIHSVDSLRLAEAISKEAGKINKFQDILLEVKTSPEETKTGLNPEDTLEVFKEISQLPNISIKGLMTIAPFTDNPEGSRLYFKTLRKLSEKIDWKPVTGDPGSILSMGMSNDFEVAIEEGSTMLRLGRAIFER